MQQIRLHIKKACLKVEVMLAGRMLPIRKARKILSYHGVFRI